MYLNREIIIMKLRNDGISIIIPSLQRSRTINIALRINSAILKGQKRPVITGTTVIFAYLFTNVPTFIYISIDFYIFYKDTSAANV